jgi:hypothetical protein
MGLADIMVVEFPFELLVLIMLCPKEKAEAIRSRKRTLNPFICSSLQLTVWLKGYRGKFTKMSQRGQKRIMMSAHGILWQRALPSHAKPISHTAFSKNRGIEEDPATGKSKSSI